MEYAFLAIAIVSEVIATSYLKQTEGFTKTIFCWPNSAT